MGRFFGRSGVAALGAFILLSSARASAADTTASANQMYQWFLSQPENQQIIESDATDEEKKRLVLALPLNRQKFGDDLALYVDVMAPYISGRLVVTSPGPGGGARSYPLGGASTGQGFVGGGFRGKKVKPAGRGMSVPRAASRKGGSSAVNAERPDAHTAQSDSKVAGENIEGGGNYISGSGVQRGGVPEKKSGANAPSRPSPRQFRGYLGQPFRGVPLFQRLRCGRASRGRVAGGKPGQTRAIATMGEPGPDDLEDRHPLGKPEQPAG